MSAIPDLIKIGSIPSDMDMSVDTDTLEPVVSSNTFCRFTLLNKGFMNSFSKIVLGLNTITDSQNTYPVNVGISALIQRAVLKVGAKTISETEDFNHFMAYKSLFIDPSINKEREQVISARGTALQLRYNNASGNFSEFNASSYGLDNGNCYIQNGRLPHGASDTRTGLLPYVWQELKQAPEFQVSLADLFPFLRFNSLPLYMFDEQISIELFFNTNDDTRMVGPSGTASTTINTAGLKLVADYIYYDGETMEQFQNANRDMNFQYVDYQLNKRTLTQAQAQTKQILNVGGAGRLVSKTFSSMSNDTADLTSILNVYHSEGPTITVSSGARQMGILTSNLRYNDKYLYPLDRVSNAIHFHDITSAESMVPHVSRDMYSGGGEGLTAEEFNGQRQDVNLKAQFYWQAHRLNRNERINSRGIEYEQQYSSMGVGPFTQRTWIEVIKQAQLKNGILDINFA